MIFLGVFPLTQSEVRRFCEIYFNGNINDERDENEEDDCDDDIEMMMMMMMMSMFVNYSSIDVSKTIYSYKDDGSRCEVGNSAEVTITLRSGMFMFALLMLI